MIKERMTDSSLMSYIKHISSYDMLDKKEEANLYKILRSKKSTEAEKDKAKERLVVTHLRLVIDCAQSFKAKHSLDMPIMDIIAYGNQGLVVAARDFNSRKSTFMTYAHKSIHWHFYKMMEDNMTISIPKHLIYDKMKVDRIKNYSAEDISKEAIIDEANMDKKRVDRVIDNPIYCEMISIDKIMEDTTFEPSVEDTSVEEAKYMDLYNFVLKQLDTFKPRRREIVKLRLLSNKTCDEISKLTNITKQGVQQHYIKAMGIIRSRIQKLYLKDNATKEDYIKCNVKL